MFRPRGHSHEEQEMKNREREREGKDLQGGNIAGPVPYLTFAKKIFCPWTKVLDSFYVWGKGACKILNSGSFFC